MIGLCHNLVHKISYVAFIELRLDQNEIIRVYSNSKLIDFIFCGQIDPNDPSLVVWFGRRAMHAVKKKRMWSQYVGIRFLFVGALQLK